MIYRGILPAKANSLCQILIYSSDREREVEKITDQDIVAKVLAGEARYFQYLLARYQGPVAKLVYFNLHDSHAVEDVTQETFLRAFKYLKSYDPDKPMKRWLFAIAANLCRRWNQKRLLTIPLKTLFHLSSDENVAEEVVQSQYAKEIRGLLRTLPPKEAVVLTFHYINSLTIQETSEVLGIPEGTVKSRLNRGLGRLRDSVLLETSAGREAHGHRNVKETRACEKCAGGN